MGPGDTVRVRNIRAYMPDGRSWTEFVVPDKSEMLVVLILGKEPAVLNDDAKVIDVNKWLVDRGWTPPKAKKVSWKDIPPEMRKLAKIAKKVHEEKSSLGSNIGGIQSSDVRVAAADLKCDGVQLRGIKAKKYRHLLERAMSNVGLFLGWVKTEKHGRTTQIILNVS